jgi:hypothetical protein
MLDTRSDRTDVMHILLRLLAVNPFPLEDIVRNDIDSDPSVTALRHSTADVADACIAIGPAKGCSRSFCP